MSKLSENFRNGMTQYFQMGGAVGFRRKPQTPEIPQDINSPPQNDVPAPETAPPASATRPIFGGGGQEEATPPPVGEPFMTQNDEDYVEPDKWRDVGVAGQGGYQTTGSSWDTTAGNYNIQGGNKFGYEPGARGKGYMALKGYSQLGPQAELGGFKFGLLPYQGVAGAVADKALAGSTREIDVGGQNEPAGNLYADQEQHIDRTVRGTALNTFDYGDSATSDWSGGATGGNVATNKTGGKVSVGYGYGQVDPAIARASKYTTGSGGGSDNNHSVPAGRSAVMSASGPVMSSHGVVTSKDYSSSSSSDDSGGGGGGK